MTESSLEPSITDMNKAIEVRDSIHKHNFDGLTTKLNQKYDFIPTTSYQQFISVSHC